MVNIIDDAEQIDISIVQPEYEDFLTYDEVDPGNNFSLTANKIQIDALAPNLVSYVQRAGTFNDFTLIMKLGITRMDGNPTPDGSGALMGVLFSRQQASHTLLTASTNLDGFSFYIRNYTHPTDPTIHYVDVFTRNYATPTTSKEWSGIMPWTQWPITVPATPRWIKIVRTGTTVNCDVYADEGLTQQMNGARLHNLILPDALPFNYFTAVCTRGPGSPEFYLSAALENYYFQ